MKVPQLPPILEQLSFEKGLAIHGVDGGRDMLDRTLVGALGDDEIEAGSGRPHLTPKLVGLLDKNPYHGVAAAQKGNNAARAGVCSRVQD